MSGELRTLSDDTGVLATVVDGLHELSARFEGLRFALVGGVAVLVHVQGHRVTEDVDAAVGASVAEARSRLLEVARTGAADATVVLTNGVPVDILSASARPPRRGLGRRREAKAEAVRWAVATAQLTTVRTSPESEKGPVQLPVATRGTLVAMKCVAIADPRRDERKRATDKLDLWRLLADDPIATVEALEELAAGPPRLHGWVAERLQKHLALDATDFLASMARGVGAPRDAEEVTELWTDVIGPLLRSQP